mmetsp:Transcript_26082/g.38596  ORF Transcript_26082/g.38596 Transcript_26082/m.38596 type:complete len:150 (+) Transcript_26082:95-544(+)
MKSSFAIQNVMLLVGLLVSSSVNAFAPVSPSTSRFTTSIYATPSDLDPQEIIGTTISVKGDVNGGYLRSCIKNEASQFRRLIGTMSPPGDDNTATIYVEGKRKMVDGFVRWCKKGTEKVGLSQILEVEKVVEEVPTGLYDGFYVKIEEE